MLGLEGVYSTGFSGVVIPILGVIPCPFNDNACVFNSDGVAVV